MDAILPNQSILFEIKSVSNLIKRQIDNMILGNRKNSLTGMQGLVVGYLSEHLAHPVFQRDIEAEFHIRRSTATGILQLMEKNGLLERQTVSHDARLKKLLPTQKAIDMHEQFICEFNKLEKKAATELTDVELQLFFTVIAKIKHNIE